jgi:hypothetical protein
MTARDIDRAIEGLARRQHGAFNRAQAFRHGATPSLVRRRLAAGAWVRLGGQVFALPSSPGTWLRQCVAATLSVPGSAVSGRSAAALHGVPGVPRAHLEVVSRWGGTNRSPFAEVRRTTHPIRARTIDRIRVVPLARCLADLTDMGVGGLGDVLDQLQRERRWLLGDVRDEWVQLINDKVRGARTLRAVLAERGDDTEPSANALERRLRRLLGGIPGMPTPIWEASAPWIGPGRRVDALIEPWHLVVEADGRAWHTRISDFEEDRWRDALAAAAGLTVVRFTWRRLTSDPQGCRAVLVAIGARTWCREGRIPALSAPSLAG